MRSLVCVDGRGWEAVVRAAARHLREGEATLVHAVDERGLQGHDLAVRGLLGRRRRPEHQLTGVSEEAAEDLLADARLLLEGLRPRLAVETLMLTGVPGEELVGAARRHGADAVFVGRGTVGSENPKTVSGKVSGWRRNRPGDVDGLFLDGKTEVRFPPHRAADVQRLVAEGSTAEVRGILRGGHLHAHLITDRDTRGSVSAHEPPRGGPEKRPLGHTARFVVDHAPCDVTILAT